MFLVMFFGSYSQQDGAYSLGGGAGVVERAMTRPLGSQIKGARRLSYPVASRGVGLATSRVPEHYKYARPF